MLCLGIRGATIAEANTGGGILSATKELLQEMVAANGVEREQVACIIFTTTPDLNAEFPAVAARELGWVNTALLCSHEMAVPGSLSCCIRILILYNTDKLAHNIVHIYMRGAEVLRPDAALGKSKEKGS